MESIGRFLRRERELKQISVEELAQATRIPLKMLHHIEEDRFDQLPGEVFTRGFLRSYAKALGVEADEVLARYGQGRRAQVLTPAPITSITPPEKGRRFGIAIALVILLILFTLALSIVLRPRHRNAPVELSSREEIIETWRGGPSEVVPSCSASSTSVTRIASSRS